MSGAIAVKRGCGTRAANGVYVEVGLSPYGMPLEFFLLDPPIVVPETMALPDRGVTLVERGGVWHIADRIGETDYPNVLDVLEEGRRFGFSRRVQHTLDFSKLTDQSRILIAHPRGYIANTGAYAVGKVDDFNDFECVIGVRCPRRTLNDESGIVALGEAEAHEPDEVAFDQHCLGLAWHDLDPTTVGELPIAVPYDGHARPLYERTMPAFTYQAHRRPDGVKPEYLTAFVASLPISRLVVVDGEQAEQRASKVADAVAGRVAVDIVPE